MFSTSGDILNLVIAVCIIALTIFLCLSLYYLISTVKKAHRVINSVEKGVNKIQELIDFLHGKIKNGGAYLMLAGELIKKGFDYFSNKEKKQEDDYEEEKPKRKRKAKK